MGVGPNGLLVSRGCGQGHLGERMPISLCMIVKNEEPNLAGSIGSVAGLVDEVIVVDTGSSDRTVEVAKGLGARTFDHRWDDNFSNARNFSLKKANGDWILVLDADEHLKADHDVVREAVKNESADAYGLHWDQVHLPRSFVQNYKTSLFRKSEGIFYSGLVHEDIFNSVPRDRWRILEARIVHNARTIDPNKAGYYLSLLEKEAPGVREGSKSQYWLGIHRSQQKNHTHAKHHFFKALEKGDRPFFAILSALCLLRVSLASPREALWFLGKANELMKDHRDDREIRAHPELRTHLEDLGKLLPDYSDVHAKVEGFFAANP